MAELCLVTCVELEDLGDAAILKVIDLDWEVLKYFKDLLDDLVWWVGAVRVLHQPLLEELAATEFQELVLNSLAFELLIDLTQEMESMHCLVRGALSCHDLADCIVVLIICVGHLYKQLTGRVLLVFGKPGTSLLLLLQLLSVE